jgi:hypothetical protein
MNNIIGKIKTYTSELEEKAKNAPFFKYEPHNDDDIPTNKFYKFLYYARKYFLIFFEPIIMFVIFIAIIVYLSIIIKFIDTKRASYSSAIKDNNTEASLADYDNIDFYGGAAFYNMTIINFVIIGIILIVINIKSFYDVKLYKKMKDMLTKSSGNIYELNSQKLQEKDNEINEYMIYMLIIILIVCVIYFLAIIFTIWLNPLGDLKMNLYNLQTEIHKNIDIEFLGHVLNLDTVVNKYIGVSGNGSITTVTYKDGDKSITKEEADQKYMDDIKNNLPEKIQYDISSIHIKINDWMYNKKKLILDNPLTIDVNEELNYRFKVLITSVLLVYYINTKNMDPIIRSFVEKDTTYQKSFFLYADKDANSILPPLSILKTTAIYKTVVAPLGETCSSGTYKLSDTNTAKLDRMYKEFKERKQGVDGAKDDGVDELFKNIKNTNDPFGHKITIIANFLVLLMFIAFFAQFFYWRYYQRTILKYWKEFLLHYGRFIVLAIMIIFVI